MLCHCLCSEKKEVYKRDKNRAIDYNNMLKLENTRLKSDISDLKAENVGLKATNNQLTETNEQLNRAMSAESKIIDKKFEEITARIQASQKHCETQDKKLLEVCLRIIYISIKHTCNCRRGDAIEHWKR
jgi:hypothetical protein